MLYINQKEYPHTPYNHNMGHGGVPEERRCIATSGCGICCACMIVEHLSTQSLSVEQCVRLSEENGANLNMGTSMRVLGPVIADMFGLEYRRTDSIEELLEHLRCGGEAIAEVAGDRNEHIGLFSDKAHYITVVSADKNELCILDPAYVAGKFDREGRRGKVREDIPFLYCADDVLADDTDKERAPFYLFKRR